MAFGCLSLFSFVNCSTVDKVTKDLKELPIPMPLPEVSKKLPTCQNLDWFVLGQEEGLRGLPLQTIEEKAKSCADITPENRDLFWHGWNAGISEYCSTSNGFALGQAGTPYQRTCPEGIMEKFDKAYQMGLKVFFIEKENQKLALQIDNMKKKSSVEAIDDLKKQRSANNRSIEEIRNRWESKN